MSHPNDRFEPIAIIGIGCLFPKSEGKDALWGTIKRGVDGVTDVPATHWKPSDYFHPDPSKPDHTYAARGGFIPTIDFRPLAHGITPNSLEATDTSQVLALIAASEALQDAGYGPNANFDRRKVSVILGVTGALELVIPLGARLGHPLWRKALREAGVDEQTAEDVVARISEGYVPWQENSFPGLLGNVVAGRVANRLNLGGTNCVVDAACASSLSAIHLASLELAAGRSDMVVAGGVDTFNDIFMYMCFSKTPALSPTGDSRPLSAAADGTILGEGLGVVVLKRLKDAEAAGDHVYAKLTAVGTSSDGRGAAIYAPNPEGQARCLRAAYELAGIEPSAIDLVEAHGTGTKVGDATELKALTEVYRASKPSGQWCAIGSIKSQIGHTKAAAGAAGLIKAALALDHKVLPPTIKVDSPQEELAGDSPFYVNTRARPWPRRLDGQPRRAAVSAFGFGGSNFHVVLEERSPDKEFADWTGEVEVAPFSAATKAELSTMVKDWSAPADANEQRRRSAALRRRFDHSSPARLVIVADRDKSDLAAIAEQTIRRLHDTRSDEPWPEGVFCGEGKPAGKLAFLLPGQGSQAPDMLRDLACQFPAFLSSLDRFNRKFAETKAGVRLSDIIYPPPAFSADERTKQTNDLRPTDIAQPAIGAVSLAAAQTLKAFGVEADLLAGHSFGELVALAVAGALDDEGLARLAVARGAAMAEAKEGGMLAVFAPAEDVERFIAENNLDLTLANKNAPKQTVLSGRVEEIARAEGLAAERKLRAIPLRVGGAFHSPLMKDAAARFGQAVNPSTWSTPRATVISTATAAPYPSDAASAKEILAGQLTRPVEFVRAVQALWEAGARTFVEVGPGTVLSGLTREILMGQPATITPLDEPKQAGIVALARLLSRLSAEGRRVDWTIWNAGIAIPEPVDEKVVGPAVKLNGANYVRPRPARPPVNKAPSKPSTADAPRSIPAATAPAPTTLPPISQQSRPPASEKSTPMSSPSAPQPPATPIAPSASPTSPPAPIQAPVAAGPLADALRANRETMTAVLSMQQQTAELHRRFLEGQEAAGRTVHLLAETQQRLLAASLGLAPEPSRLSFAPPAIATAIPASAVSAPPFAAAPTPSHSAPLTPVVAPAPVAQAPQASPASAPVKGTEATARPSNDRVAGALLAIVADKTGYPADMLKLDMELDGDLGIDSIKRVEILSAVQEAMPELPAVKSEDLGKLRTLGAVLDLLGASSATPSAPAAAATPAGNVVRQRVMEIVADKTGYPADMLGLDMQLDGDLGIDSIKRVEILSAVQEAMPELPAVKSEELGKLRTLRDVLETVGAFSGSAASPSPASPAISAAPAAADEANAAAAAAPVTLDVFAVRAAPLDEADARPVWRPNPDHEWWIAGDQGDLAQGIADAIAKVGVATRVIPLEAVPTETPTTLGGLVIVATASRFTIESMIDAVRLLKVAGPGLRAAGGSLTTVSLLDGAFGLESEPADPLSGSLAGLAKTAAREWADVRVKAIDVSRETNAEQIAGEIFRAGPVEVGLQKGVAISLVLEPRKTEAGASPFGPGDVVLITGGARGVTAAAAAELAKRSKATFVLWGRSAAPAVEPTWLAAAQSEAEIQREILAHEPVPPSPKTLREKVRAVLAGREINATLARLTDWGGRAHYFSVDVRDPASVKDALAQARKLGSLRGILHGAGVLADRRIEDKTDEQVRDVVETKLTGLLTLLEELRADELKAIAFFSSSTARFGRVGQIDYGMANEALNKLAQREARRRPATRVVSANWGPWDGGMVNPGLAKVFAAEGVGLIPLGAGASLLAEELSQPPGGPVEIVVLAAGSKIETSEPTPPSTPASSTPAVAPIAEGLRVAFERDLDVESHPFLRGHVLDGKAVLPVAMMVEWLAHGALHGNPGLVFRGVDNLRVLKGLVLPDETMASVAILAGKAVRDENDYRVAVELRGRLSGGRETRHATATVTLGARPETAQPPSPEPSLDATSLSVESLYEQVLFHGPEFQAITALEGSSDEGIAGQASAAPAPGDWIRQPLRQRWITNPLALDTALQLLICWTVERAGSPSLPTGFSRFRQFARSFPVEAPRIVARVSKRKPSGVTADIEFLGREGELLARLEGVEHILDAGLATAFRKNQLTRPLSAH